MPSWLTYFAVSPFESLNRKRFRKMHLTEDHGLLLFTGSPNENLKINFTPVNTAQPLITPLNHIEFSLTIARDTPMNRYDVTSGWQETGFFSFKPDSFRINTARVPYDSSTRRTIENIEPSTIKAIGD